MKILAFAASNSSQSINRKLVEYTANLADHQVEFLDLNHYEMPIYSADREQQSGIPELAHQFLQKIGEADGLIISFAEHNGNYSVAYKNIFDWASRVQRHVFQDKPSVLLATSPGPGGAGRVLEMAKTSAPHFGMPVVASVSVPSFGDNFDTGSNQIKNSEIEQQLKQAVASLK